LLKIYGAIVYATCVGNAIMKIDASRPWTQKQKDGCVALAGR